MDFDWSKAGHMEGAILSCHMIILPLMSYAPKCADACADPEGGTGGPDPPWNLKILPKKR